MQDTANRSVAGAKKRELLCPLGPSPGRYIWPHGAVDDIAADLGTLTRVVAEWSGIMDAATADSICKSEQPAVSAA